VTDPRQIDAPEVHTFDRVRVTDDCPFVWLRNTVVVLAYFGSGGVSVAVEGFDDYIPLNWNEFEVLPR